MEALGPAGRPLYVSIDVDGLDPGIMPGTGTPEPGGLTWGDVTELLQAAADRFRVVGFDVVEVLPERDRILSEYVAARLVYKLIGYLERARLNRAATGPGTPARPT
jgi:agmatinase